MNQPTPNTDTGSAEVPYTNRIGRVFGGKIVQAHETESITVINSYVLPRPIQLPDIPAPGPRPELDQLRAVHREADVGQGQIIVLHGPAGSGKTQIAAHFLDQQIARFADGILVADLQGSSEGGPADVSDVLDRLLRAIHVGADAIPADFGARCAAWRSYTYGREVAVLVEDAFSAAQVRALTPGRGPFLMIVTTRHSLVSLRLDGADVIEIHHPHTGQGSCVMKEPELTSPARLLYQSLLLIPGPTWSAEAAAATADLPLHQVDALLPELVAARLLTCPTPGRFAQADVPRSDIRHQRAPAGAGTDGALTRALEFYLVTAAAADIALNSHRWHLAPVFDRAEAEEFTRSQALDWLEAELGNLRACVRVAHSTGRHSLTWQFCETLKNVFLLRKHFQTWEDTYSRGLASAEATGDSTAQALMLGGLGALHLTRGDVDRALELHMSALVLWERARHRLGQASALEASGVCELARHRPDRARALFIQAYDIHELLNRPRGKALLTRRLGEAARDLGELDDATGHFQSALEFFTDAEEPYLHVRIMAGLAVTHLATGDLDSAYRAAVQARSIAIQIGALAEEAGALVLLADITQRQERPRDEQGFLSRAMALYSRLGSPEGARVQFRLSEGAS